MRVIIRNGRIVDPGNCDGIRDILIEDEKIIGIYAPNNSKERTAHWQDGCKVTEIDASNKIVVPGLIDMHVHLREPGHEYKETILSGTRAAVCGGFTSVCAMPNTNPVNDNRQVTEFIREQAKRAGNARVYPVAAISKNLEGKFLCEYAELKAAGAVAISDDGRPVENSQFMRRAMEYAKGFGLPVISHCEDIGLAAGGVMNEGETATRMGLAGIPNAAESVMVMRDIALAGLTGAPVHVAHVSTAESVQAIRTAKKQGIPVTAETAPHYFTLTDAAVENYDTHAKMNPPLRTSIDVAAVKEGLADGTIDVIATDHAPHSAIEKDVEFDQAANGIIGLETALSLSLQLVSDNVISLTQMIATMSANPAKILGLPSGIREGLPADITIIDTEIPYRIDSNSFRSLSRNTPFNGRQVKGKATTTIVAGKVVFRQEDR